MSSSNEFDAAIRELRELDKKFGETNLSVSAARAFINGRLAAESTDPYAREDLRFVAARLEELGRVDFARGFAREALSARYLEKSGFTEHAPDCAAKVAPLMCPGPCDCRPA